MCCCSNGTADCSVCKEKYIFTERDLSSRPSGYLTARTMRQKQRRFLSTKKEPYMYEQRPIKDTNCRAEQTMYGDKGCVNGLLRRESYVCAQRDISNRRQGTPEGTRYCCNRASKETYVRRGLLRKESYICAQRDTLLRIKEIYQSDQKAHLRERAIAAKAAGISNLSCMSMTGLRCCVFICIRMLQCVYVYSSM